MSCEGAGPAIPTGSGGTPGTRPGPCRPSGLIRWRCRALALDLPDGPVADLACGPSGSALLAAEHGRLVTAVDVSEVALGLLGDEARRRGLGHLITLVQADLPAWSPEPRSHALVLCTGFWLRRPSPRRPARSRTAACWPGRPTPPRAAARIPAWTRGGAWRRGSPPRSSRPASPSSTRPTCPAATSA